MSQANGAMIAKGTDVQTTAVVERKESNQVQLGFFNVEGFELMQRIAKMLAQSTLVPKEYQGNIPNCVIALNMANRMQADPLMVMQNLHIVNGKPGWSAQFLVSTFNTCGRFSSIRYEWVGKEGDDTWGCRAWTIEKATGERLVGSTVTLGMAKKEGWYSRNGSKWQSMPQQMLMYRAAAFLVRAYAPELAMGMHTVEELEDVIDLPSDAYEVRFEEEARAQANGPVIDVAAQAAAEEPAPNAKQAPPKGQEQAETAPPEQPSLAPDF